MTTRNSTPSPSGNAPILRRSLRFFGIELRAGEAPIVTRLFLAFFFCLTFQYAAKTVRQATFLDSHGATQLPWVYLLVALFSYPVLMLYGRLAGHWSQRRMIVLTSAVNIAGLGCFAWFLHTDRPWLSYAFYLWITVMLALTLTQFWTLAGQQLDPRQARRLFGLIGVGGILGSIAGGQLAQLLARVGTSQHVLAAAAIALILATGLAQGLHRPVRPARVDRPVASDRTWSALRRSRHLRLVAAVLTLSVIVAQVVDLQFNWIAERVTDDLTDRTQFFGHFYSLMGLVALALQLLLTSRLLRVHGVAFALRVPPIAALLGSGGLLLSAGLAPGLVVAVGLTLKASENGLRYSLDQATRELLFLPIPAAARARAKAAIDVVVQRGAKGLAAILLIPVAIGWWSPLDAGWISVLLIGLWIAALPALHRAYTTAFRARLVRRGDRLTAIDLDEPGTLEALFACLGSTDRRQVLHGLELLTAHGKAHLVPPWLLHHDDDAIRRHTMRALALAERHDTAPWIARQLSHINPSVRATAVRSLSALQHDDADATMLASLRDDDPATRGAAIAYLIGCGDSPAATRAHAALAEMANDSRATVRREAATCLGAMAEPIGREILVRLLYDPNDRVVRRAVGAVGQRAANDERAALYLPTLVSLLRDRRLKHEVRSALTAFGTTALPALTHFLDAADEPIWVRRALPKTIAKIGGAEAVRALVGRLDQPDDTFLQGKMIEALAGLDIAPRHGDAILRQIRIQAGRCLRVRADRDALAEAASPAPTSLLTRLLHERETGYRRNVFGLVAALYPTKAVWAAHETLFSPYGDARAHALEFLANTLPTELRQPVFSVIGNDDRRSDAPLDFTARAPRQRSRAEVLRRYLTVQHAAESDASFSAVAALDDLHRRAAPALEPLVARLAETARDPFVRETAAWVRDARLQPQVARA